MKDELGGKITTKFFGLRPKCRQKSKRHKKVCHKKNIYLKIMKIFQKQLNLRINKIIKKEGIIFQFYPPGFHKIYLC